MERGVPMPDNAVSLNPKAREHLRGALLRGDRAAAAAMLAGGCAEALRHEKNAVLRALTVRNLAGQTPFCQLTAAAQAAAALADETLPPVACCGALRGNTSAASHDYMLMLLRAWGLPTLDLGVDVPTDGFLRAIAEHGLRFAVCAAFSGADMDRVREIDAEAARRGLRGNFRLAVCGASLDAAALSGLPVDCPEYKTAAVAEWMVRIWKG